jgi:hypothetical protein
LRPARTWLASWLLAGTPRRPGRRRRRPTKPRPEFVGHDLHGRAAVPSSGSRRVAGAGRRPRGCPAHDETFIQDCLKSPGSVSTQSVIAVTRSDLLTIC